MKTIFLKSLAGAGGIIAGLFLLVGIVQGQENLNRVYTNENTGFNTSTPELSSELPDKVILIFDTTTLTFEFDDHGFIALVDESGNLPGNQITIINRVTVAGSEYSATSTTISDLMEEAVDEESEMELKEWMLKPSEWIK